MYMTIKVMLGTMYIHIPIATLFFHPSQGRRKEVVARPSLPVTGTITSEQQERGQFFLVYFKRRLSTLENQNLTTQTQY